MAKKTPAELLREAADDLENAIPKNGQFAMLGWGWHKGEHHPKKNDYCGTSCCAAGWLSLMPKWRKRGFTSKWQYDWYWKEWKLFPGNGGWFTMAENVFGEEAGYHIGEIFKKIQLRRETVLKELRQLANRAEKQGWTR